MNKDHSIFIHQTIFFKNFRKRFLLINEFKFFVQKEFSYCMSIISCRLPCVITGIENTICPSFVKIPGASRECLSPRQTTNPQNILWRSIWYQYIKHSKSRKRWVKTQSKQIFSIFYLMVSIYYSTVTDFAKFLGWSTSVPFETAT